MSRRLLFGLLGLFTSLAGYGQRVDCSNIGFEEGSFRGWERWQGYVFDSAQKAIYVGMRPGSLYMGTGVTGHTITSTSDGYDPKIIEKMPMVAPGSQHSVRIGTSALGSTADQLRTTLLVSPEAALLVYRFAIVLQNPTHKPFQQPAFTLVVRTMRGDTIPCGYYKASASNQTAGFSQQPNTMLIYRNWTTSVLDLRPYIGQQLTLEVTAHGCTDGGHFGYAYFDAQCLRDSITPSSFCSSRDTTMRLSAPDGFDQYQWNTGETTATIDIKPHIGDTYAVKVRSQSTLRPDCSTQLDLTYQINDLLVPTSEQVMVCAGESYRVGDSVYTRSGTYRTVFKRSPLCDSVVVTKLIIQPLASSTQNLTLCLNSSVVVGDSVYQKTGSYQTRIKRATPLCDSLVTTHLVITQVEIEPMQDKVIMLGDSVQLTVARPPGTAYQYSWSPKEGLSCPLCATTWAAPTRTTRYQVTASIPTLACKATGAVRVQVMPCILPIPNAFTPNGDGVNDVFTVVANPCLGRVKQLSVFNRWGQVIFHQEIDSSAATFLGWDGSYQGAEASVGVYSYKLTTESSAGKVNDYRGTVTLLR